MERYSAGENVASFCTKCRLVLDHVIVAMDADKIVKVTCMTCGGTHRFRDPGAVQAGRSPRARQGERAKPPLLIWEDVIAGAKGEERGYDMAAKYRPGDIILHPVFGKGVVMKLYPNKCGVLFKDKERLMASGN